MSRRFKLIRDEDPTGISGTGYVAQGVEFDDGTCAMRWLSQHRSTAVYADMADLAAIHNHNGLTQIVWDD